MTPEEIQRFQQVLLNLKDRITGDIDHLRDTALRNNHREATGELSGYSLHIADQGTDNFDREFTFDLVSNEQDILYKIDEALERIDSGTFGKCTMCSESITKQRLEALPFAPLCIECAKLSEQAQKRRKW
ncbi:MAG: TraR/DksA C4-type zinc finger protein [Candidatus Auribacterota bacterium]|jgi:RNA polymerase-binding protein DksA|uniref:TraR/DksA family transcriptional regulator n=1 Tax=Candidatus Auribacter fodinae TaxID=2093366 RepID=A0A3A4R5N2_9BACT|nr:MAG: TraR/DksA family transcriptional regulator [Candidatus Auribacter fodinae]